MANEGGASSSGVNAQVVVTDGALVVSFGDDLKAQISECVKRSGTATFTIKEVEITRVPSVKGLDVVVD